MALIPEYLFPSWPARLVGKDEDILVGLEAFTQPAAGAMYDKRISFMDVIDLDLTGYGERALDIKIFTFDNDLELHLEVTAGGFMRLVLKYNGNITAVSGSWNNAQAAPFSSSYRTGWGDLSNCKFALCACFSDPVENITPCRSLAWMIFMPSYRIIDEYGTRLDNILEKVFKGNTAWLDGEINQVMMDNTNFPVYCGTLDRGNTETNFWDFTDLATFNTAMKTAGKGTNKNVWDDTPEQPEDDTSGTGGGGGSYDPSSDPVDFPAVPTGGALTSGMLKGFVIGQAGLIALQNKLWDMSIFDIQTQFQKLVNQPLDCLISLHCLPCLPTTGANPENVKLGSFDTQVSALRITNQYLEISGGSLKVPKYWGSALDYAPYSRAEIFVPFVGFRNIQIEDIQGLTLTLKYHVDVLTGDCVAYLKCGNSVLYSWTGNCLSHIPCTSSSNDRLAKGIGAIGSIGVGLVTGNPAAAAGGVIASASNVATSKNHVQRSGDVAGSPGIMSEFTPYIIFHRPKQSLAKYYNKFKGYPCNITYTLSSLKGYTEVEHVHLTGISGATDTELNEIENLLKEGVII